MTERDLVFKTVLKGLGIVIIMSLLLLGFSSCSSQKQEAEDTAEATEEEDISLYGDESLGIDAGADEALRDYRTILLGGIDNGDRADIMMILCINKESGDIKVFTVNRDTYMQIADGRSVDLYGHDYEYQRCNEAYAVDGKYGLMKELNQHLDLNIREFIGADWATTAKFVDALGGLEVDIPSQSMLDGINSLISSYPDGDQELIQGTGRQTLKGWQAVHYLRVRKYDGGSAIAREERNRAVFEDLFNKAKSMSVEEISAVYDEIAGDLDTNMSRNTLTDTFAQIASSNVSDAGGWPYETVRRWEPEVKCVYDVTNSLYSNVVQLHANLFDQTEYLPSKKVQELSDQISDREKNYLKENW